jgi:hypothetical protein
VFVGVECALQTVAYISSLNVTISISTLHCCDLELRCNEILAALRSGH